MGAGSTDTDRTAGNASPRFPGSGRRRIDGIRETQNAPLQTPLPTGGIGSPPISSGAAVLIIKQMF
jgi:hypothetical protein